MIADITRHKIAYSLLAILAGLYLAFVYSYRTAPMYLLIGTVVFATAYFLWGIFHHLQTKSLYGKVVLEYFLVATLALVIVATLLV